jgi:chromosome segregation ATPase
LEHKKAVDQDYYKMLSIKDSVQIVERENTRLVQENTELRRQMSELRREMQEAQGEFKEMGRQLELAREDRGTTQRERDQLEVQVTKEAEKVQKLQH